MRCVRFPRLAARESLGDSWPPLGGLTAAAVAFDCACFATGVTFPFGVDVGLARTGVDAFAGVDAVDFVDFAVPGVDVLELILVSTFYSKRDALWRVIGERECDRSAESATND